VAERAIRSIRSILHKYLHANNTYRYVEDLQKLVNNYNSSYHRTIKMKPSQVNDSNKGEVFRNMYGGSFKTGDPVRVSKSTHVFSRGYTPNWSQEIFFVKDQVRKHKIPVHTIVDYSKKPVLGTWYPKELQVVTPPTFFTIERILKTRLKRGRKEHYVKWLGYPTSMNSWVSDIDNYGR
jgi:hypothetical protein